MRRGIQQVEEIGSLLPQGESWDLNWGLQVWQHVPLPTRPSHLPPKYILCRWASDTKIPVMIRDQDKPVCPPAGTCPLFSGPTPLPFADAGGTHFFCYREGYIFFFLSSPFCFWCMYGGGGSCVEVCVCEHTYVQAHYAQLLSVQSIIWVSVLQYKRAQTVTTSISSSSAAFCVRQSPRSVSQQDANREMRTPLCQLEPARMKILSPAQTTL